MELTTEKRELTLTEVAARLKITEDTARIILQKRLIPSRKQGRRWLVLESDVEKYLEEERKKSQSSDK